VDLVGVHPSSEEAPRTDHLATTDRAIVRSPHVEPQRGQPVARALIARSYASLKDRADAPRSSLLIALRSSSYAVALGQQHLGEQRQHYRRGERHPVAHLAPPGHMLFAEEAHSASSG
jgi:hypothetical protein